jgi:hypothetical protein
LTPDSYHGGPLITISVTISTQEVPEP